MGEMAGLRRIFAADMPIVYYELLFIGFSIMMGMSLSSSFLPILANDLDPSGVLVGIPGWTSTKPAAFIISRYFGSCHDGSPKATIWATSVWGTAILASDVNACFACSKYVTSSARFRSPKQ